MSSKTSFFNKSIFKSDIKRFWWTSLLEWFILFITIVAPIYDYCVEFVEKNFAVESFPHYELDWTLSGGIIIILAFAVGIPVMLFSYMQFSASVSMHHSIPVRRSELLCTKILTGLMLTIIPVLVNGAVLGAIVAVPQYRELIGVASVVNWCIAGVFYIIASFSLAVMVNMMTGHPVGTLIFTVGFAVLPVIITFFLEMLFSMEYFGYNGGNIVGILGYIYPETDTVLTFPIWLIYPIIGVAFFAGAYLLYKYRKLENHGEVIAFSWLKPVFIGIIAMLASMFSMLYFNGILDDENVLWMIPIGVLGTVIAWMISRKRLSLKGVHRPVLIYIVSALLVCMAIHFDITGYETRIPDIEDVKSVQFGYKKDYLRHVYLDEPIEYFPIGGIDTAFTDEKDIANVIALHEYIVENKDVESKGEYTPIEYTLKDGSKVTRYYNIDRGVHGKYLKPIYETPQIRSKYALVDGTEKEFTEIEIYNVWNKDSVDVKLYPDNANMERLIEALKKDIENLTYENMTYGNVGPLRVQVEFVYKTDIADEELKKVIEEDFDSDSYVISSAFINTRNVLNSMGIVEAKPNVNDIEKLEIYTWTGVNYPKDADVTAIITDRETIGKIHSEFDNLFEGDLHFVDRESVSNIRIWYTLKSGDVFEVSCSYDEDRIPEIFKPYFE